MATRLTQLSYNAGELGEFMTGRVDDAKYAAGLAECTNMYPTPQGPVRNRAGFVYVNEVKDSSKAVRLIPFVYSADQQIVVELGNYYARFHLNGQTLMKADGSAPYEIATPWPEETLFDIHYTQNADIMTLVHPRFIPQELRRYSMTDWRLVAVNLITTLAAPSSVSASRSQAAADDKNADKYTQSYVVTALNADRTQESQRSAVASCVANLYATGTTVSVSWSAVPGATYYRIYKLQGGIYGYIGETTGLSIVDDNIAPETGTTPPYIDDVFRVGKGITSVTVTNGGSGYGTQKYISGVVNTGIERWDYPGPGVSGSTNTWYSWGDLPVAMHTGGNPTCSVEDSGGSGAAFNLSFGYAHDYSPHYGEHSTTYCVTGVTVANGGIGYQNPKLIVDYSGGKLHYRYRLQCTTEYDVPQLVVEDATGRGAILEARVEGGQIKEVVVVYPGMGYTNPTVRVVSRAGSGAAFSCTLSDAGDYPAAVGYFEQRRIFAGSNLRPQNIWMTATGTDSNMTYHLPLQDTDRISFAVAARDLNQIQHIVPLQQLIALTSAAEWRVSPLNSDAITPSSISVRPQSYIGASKVQPEIINTNLLYAAARGGHVRELSYDYTAGGYITGDISIRAPHLFAEDNVVTDMALTKSPDPILWCVRQDGVLLGLSYVPEQKIGAWFTYRTDGRFESAAVVQEGLNDYLYVVVERSVNGESKRFIERQAVRDDDNRSFCYLDCAGHYHSSQATTTLSGLDWLEGRTVTAVADGVVVTGLKVEGGKLTLPVAAKEIWAGLPYTSQIKTLPVTMQVSDGSMARGRIKAVNRVALRLYRTSGLEVGPDEEHVVPVKPRTIENYGKPPELRSGETEVTPLGHWQDDGTVVIRQTEPLPFTLICHSTDVVIGDA